MILFSVNIGIVKAWHLPFVKGVGNHQSLMIDVYNTWAIGVVQNSGSKVRAVKLKLKDLSAVKILKCIKLAL